MENITNHIANFVKQAINTLQGTNVTYSDSDIFYAIHSLSFLPQCPTSSEAVSKANIPFVESIVQQYFPKNISQNNNNNNNNNNNRNNNNNDQGGPIPLISVLGSSVSTADDNPLKNFSNLLSLLAFSRLVEIHLALSKPSPFPTKKSWYGATKAVSDATRRTLELAKILLNKSFNLGPNSSPSASAGAISGMIAVCAAVVMRAIHVEHFLEELRSADVYLGQSLIPLEVCKRYARDMYNECNIARSIDMMAVHCPFFVVIVAATMENLPAAKQVEKERKELAFAQKNSSAKNQELNKLSLNGSYAFMNVSSNANAACHFTNTSRYVEEDDDGSNRNNNNYNNNNNNNGEDSPKMGPAKINATNNCLNTNKMPTSRFALRGNQEQSFVDWTHEMINCVPDMSMIEDHLNNNNNNNSDSANGNSFPPESISMGNIPQGVLQMINSFKDECGILSDQISCPVDTFVQIFIAGRLASQQLTRALSCANGVGNTEKAWQNASRAYAMCADAYSAPFAEVAAVARLKMGDVPADERALRGLGANVLEDVALALRCGHPVAFDAAIGDASKELAEKGLLASVMTLRTHAVLMLLKKCMNSSSSETSAQRLDVAQFFEKYRGQLPQTLLDTELQLIVPLILGQRLKGRLQDQTLVMAKDPFVFDF